MWIRLGLCAWVLSCLFVPTEVFAQEKPSQPFVVLIGIDQYKDSQIKSRKFAEADAKALYDVFISKDHLDVKPENIKLLLGKEDAARKSQPATRENILKAMKWLESSATQDDLVVFAFLGQGAPMGERVCYFGSDSTFKNRVKDAVASGDVQHLLEKVKSQRMVGVFDVNFLGIDTGKEPMPDANLQNIFKQFFPADEDAQTMPSRTIFLANDGLKPSLDLAKNGVLAAALVEGLKGSADKFGYEPDGNITVTELAKFVKERVHELAVEFGKSNDEKSQQARILDSHKTDFIVDQNPKAFPKSQERLSKFAKIVEESKLEKNVAEEGQNLLSRMPTLKTQKDLRKVYQKLADGLVDVEAFRTERLGVLDTTKLTDREAQVYAQTVVRAAKYVRDSYVKDVPQTMLVEQAVLGLFTGLNEKVPSAIKEKVDNIKNTREIDHLKLLSEARKHLGRREDLDQGKDVTMSLHSMLHKLDKHTDYMDPETAKLMSKDLRGHFFGIGVQIRQNTVRDQLQVVTPIFGSPAYKKKIYAGDIITQIVREVDSDGKKVEPPEIIPTKGMTTEEAVKKILGKEGTKVKLIVEREGAEKPLEFELIRGRVEVESVHGYQRNKDDSWNYVVDPEHKICYIRLSQFGHNTYRDLEKTMKKLYEAGIKGFVLDLRFNPGGLLDSAVKISDLFIDDGMIVSIRPRKGPETSYVGQSGGSYKTFPMVCLINGQSASASEIVSACLQDHGRAIVIGTRSYGKGSVQTIQHFAETGGSLKLTTATYWRPSGRNINKASTGGKDEDEWGVTPDQGFEVKLSTKDLIDLTDHLRDREIIYGPAGPPKTAEAKVDYKDRQLEKALDYLRGYIRANAKNATARN